MTNPTVVTIIDDSTIQIATIGLQGPIGPGGTPNSQIREVSIDTVMTVADGTVIANTASGPLTITLPLASTAYNAVTESGPIFNIPNTGQNPVTVNCQDSDTISGHSSITISGAGNLQVQAGPPSVPYTIL